MEEKKVENRWAVESPEGPLPLAKCYRCPTVALLKPVNAKVVLVTFGRIKAELTHPTESLATGENSHWYYRSRCHRRPLRGAEGSSVDVE